MTISSMKCRRMYISALFWGRDIGSRRNEQSVVPSNELVRAQKGRTIAYDLDDLRSQSKVKNQVREFTSVIDISESIDMFGLLWSSSLILADVRRAWEYSVIHRPVRFSEVPGAVCLQVSLQFHVNVLSHVIGLFCRGHR